MLDNLRWPFLPTDYSFWGTCLVSLFSIAHSNSCPLLPTLILARRCPHQFWPCALCTNSRPVMSTPILALCSLHQFWPGAVFFNSGPVTPALILFRCCPHQFWLGAVPTKSGLVQSASIMLGAAEPTPTKCSPHLSLPSAAFTQLNEEEYNVRYDILQ